MPSLDGAVVLVTGANGGLGTHFVHEALARGAAKIYATARTPRAWDDERVVPLTLDVTDRASIAGAVSAAADVTVLVNNAGATPPSASLLDVSEADIRANVETNFFGPVLLARAFAPILAAKQGSILATCTPSPAGTPSAASTAPRRPHCGRPPTRCASSSHPWACT
ncbi:SDR family NAD(P)-dependent oxidoreductase [Streptomyces sp. 3213.3]|uniref:SDR family NAD(P)-dependent oxidoreductase n=1 Tax=Streptomyces sp. 3213.3 TaxID=1855348 RepID=UPI000AF941CE